MTLIDSYTEENYDNDGVIDILHPSSIPDYYSAYGQCFTVKENMKLTKARFYLRKYGIPTGKLVARLYNITGTYGIDGKPIGSHLAESEEVTIEELPTSHALIDFNFIEDNQYEMISGSHYVIVVLAKSGDVGFPYKEVWVGRDYSSPTHDGNYCSFSDNNWYASSAYDTIFYVYGTPLPPPPEKPLISPPLISDPQIAKPIIR